MKLLPPHIETPLEKVEGHLKKTNDLKLALVTLDVMLYALLLVSRKMPRKKKKAMKKGITPAIKVVSNAEQVVDIAMIMNSIAVHYIR